MEDHRATRQDDAALPRVRRVIAFVDLVESVRLIRIAEDSTISAWRQFVHQARTDVLPRFDGRMVKSLGDGMLLEFERTLAALGALRELTRLLSASNQQRPADVALLLRCGMHVADVVVDDFDIFGAGVNLAARLTQLASPGEVVYSSAVQFDLIPTLDGDAEDLGLCHLKHVDEPVRAFRLSLIGQGDHGQRLPARSADELKPLLAVLPLLIESAGADAAPFAAALSDHLVATLAVDASWAIVSRLSTAALDGRSLSARDAARALGARYLLTGSVRFSGDTIDVQARIVEPGFNDVVDEARVHCAQARALDPDRGVAAQLSRFAAGAVLARHIDLGEVPALPTIPSYAMLLRAMRMLHSLEQSDMQTAKDMLDHLSERHPRSPEAHAWCAKWHFLQLAQVTATDHAAQIRTARVRLAQGLDAQPRHAMSLALDGHLSAFVDGDLARGEATLREAVSAGPNESLAWIFLSGALTNLGRGAEAVEAIRHSLHLSPLDPLGYYVDLFAAGAYKAAGDLPSALAHAERSVRRNAVHLAGWVQLIVLQVANGQPERARTSASRYLLLRPGASVQRFLDRHPARGTGIAERDAEALLEAGIPR